MNQPRFQIGDKVKRIDYQDNDKVYMIEKIREYRGTNIYHMLNQEWVQGWAWVAEWNIEKVIS